MSIAVYRNKRYQTKDEVNYGEGQEQYMIEKRIIGQIKELALSTPAT